MMRGSVSFLVVAMAGVAMLGACSPLGIATGAGATAGIAAASEGGLSGAATDFRIRTQINESWFRHDVDMFRKVGLTVDQGRVLLTGIVQNPDHRVEAVRLVWQVAGVKQVINEIRVADEAGFTSFISDAWISGRLRTAMTFDREIHSIHYSIDTVDGTVYIMGVARNQMELDRVVNLAKNIGGVKQVVSYAKMLGEDVQSYEAGAPAPAGAAAAAPQPINDMPPDAMPMDGGANSSVSVPTVESAPL